MQARAVPDRGVRRGRLRGRDARAQPVERRRDREPLADRRRRDRVPRHARVPEGPRGPRPPQEARAIGATVDGVRVWSLYVPNGRALDDPHYDYKLDWLAALTEYTRDEARASTPTSPFALMGDFNIAPIDADNGDPTVVAGPRRTSRRPSARRSPRSRPPASPTSCARSCPRASPTGTTSSCGSRATRACASTSSSARTRFADAVTDAAIHRNERKGDAPSDHVPGARRPRPRDPR